jgi:hypothetical protein
MLAQLFGRVNSAFGVHLDDVSIFFRIIQMLKFVLILFWFPAVVVLDPA